MDVRSAKRHGSPSAISGLRRPSYLRRDLFLRVTGEVGVRRDAATSPSAFGSLAAKDVFAELAPTFCTRRSRDHSAESDFPVVLDACGIQV